MSTSNTKNARIVMSEDEDDNRLSDGDNDDDEQNIEPVSAEALELLETEKVLKAGYLLKKGEKRRVCVQYYKKKNKFLYMKYLYIILNRLGRNVGSF